MNMMSCMTLPQSLIFVFSAMALSAVPANASGLVDSVAEADTVNTNTSDSNYFYDSTAVAGGVALAEVNCTGDCLISGGPVGRAKANSDFGLNRVYAYAEGGVFLATESSARSFWMDEWTFSANSQYSGGPVTLKFHLDGTWEDASFDFSVAVFNATQKLPTGDDQLLFDEYGHPIKLQEVVDISLNNSILDAIPLLGLLYPNFQVNQAAGTAQNGLIDGVLTISFPPQIGEVYTLAAGMQASVVIPINVHNTGTADFYNSAVLSAVYLPQGLTLSTDSGTAYNVAVVPEADAWAMLLAGLGLVGFAARRRLG